MPEEYEELVESGKRKFELAVKYAEGCDLVVPLYFMKEAIMAFEEARRKAPAGVIFDVAREEADSFEKTVEKINNIFIEKCGCRLKPWKR